MDTDHGQAWGEVLIYGSVCSGVEAATVAWHGLGWKPAWFCEFDKFPSAVLNYHYPEVPNLHDMTQILENEVFNERSIKLLVGGTPCQSFSIAGLRKGLDDYYTKIPWRGKGAADCPDGPRYKAMGNSMAVPVMRWIGERIEMFERLDI